jgi:hypothetical protein
MHTDQSRVDRARSERIEDEVARVDRLLDPSISLDRAWADVNTVKGRAASMTVEALAYQLRDGVDALREPSAQRRLSELDEAQLLDVAERLTLERWNKTGTARVPPWAPEEIETLMEMWSALR